MSNDTKATPKTSMQAFAWTETKWYANCTHCAAQIEVDSDACLSGSENSQKCSVCGDVFAFRAGT